MKINKKLMTIVSLILVFVTITAIPALAAEYTYTYYPKYSGSSGSLVDGLKAVGVDSSYSNREKIASLNGISGYSGSSSQNTQLLKLLKAGKLIKSKTASSSSNTSYYPKYTGSSGSLVDALKAVGVDSSYSNREKIAAANGISNYSGTNSQNTQMLNLLKKGTLKKAGTSSGSSTTTPTNVIAYAAYKGVDYTKQTTNAKRIKALDKAKQMVTIQWTAPCDFPTWASSAGVFNRATATDGTSNTKFVKGKTYTGIPYSMTSHSYDDAAWIKLLNNGISTSSMTATYLSYPKAGTAKGIDCSYFVYMALSGANTGYSLTYQNTASMLTSSYYTKISKDQMKPGDLFLKNGHVMMYVGKTGDKYAVFEADAVDSKCSYNTYSLKDLTAYSAYKFKGFKD